MHADAMPYLDILRYCFVEGMVVGMGIPMPIEYLVVLEDSAALEDMVALCNFVQIHIVLLGRSEIYNRTQGQYEVVLQFLGRTKTYSQPQG